MTQTRDLIKKMADFFKSEEYYEKGEDARLELSPDDVRCVNRLIQRMSNLDKISAEFQKELDICDDSECDMVWAVAMEFALEVIDKYRNEVSE